MTSNAKEAGATKGSSSPIFIMGITHRSGTNYLRDLLGLHPDCTILDNLGEDFLVSELSALDGYAKAVSRKWNPKWNQDGLDRRLRQFLGEGLLAFLESKKLKQSPRLVTKTPSVNNLHCFYSYFPSAKLIIIVRRGEDVVESGVRSFNWSYRSATRRWARAARTIIRFRERTKSSDLKPMVVKYEDLYSNPKTELHRIFGYTQLDPDRYDFAEIRDLPVKGSSATRHEEGRALHWRPVEKSDAFNPLDRAGGWSPAMRARFDWVAGNAAERLGYEVDKSFRRNLLWICYNLATDSWEFVIKQPHKISRALTRRLPRRRSGATPAKTGSATATLPGDSGSSPSSADQEAELR